jgi:hypothetical protein
LCSGILTGQSTSYLSALISEKNQVRCDAAYKTRLCQIYEVK